MREAAPAKVNLFLHITGRRADGYHLLESLFVFADVCDWLEVCPADDLSLNIIGPQAASIPNSADNLVLAAARALQPLSGLKGARLTLEKNLPVAAGIGGGSADAAAALRLLVRFWGLKTPAAQLHDIALALGADVPACLDPAPKLVRGIGDILQPLSGLPPLFLLLANPGVAVPTAAVFGARAGLGGRFSPAGPPNFGRIDTERLVEILATSSNDLEAAAISLAPQIRTVIEVIGAQADCRIARMSGSGATCFGLFTNQGAAIAAATEIAAQYPAWWVWAGSIL